MSFSRIPDVFSSPSFSSSSFFTSSCFESDLAIINKSQKSFFIHALQKHKHLTINDKELSNLFHQNALCTISREQTTIMSEILLRNRRAEAFPRPMPPISSSSARTVPSPLPTASS